MPGSDRKPNGNVDSAVRERLLQAAIEAFARFGFEGASLRAIAQEAGVAFQLITYYFGSKDDLWLAAVERLYGEREKLDESHFDPHADFEPQVRHWVRVALQQAFEEPQLARILCQEYLAGGRRWEKYLKPQSRKASPQFYFLFDEAHRRGLGLHLSTDEMYVIMRSIRVMASLAPEVMAPVIGDGNSKQAVEMLADFVVNVLLRGHGAKPPPSIKAVPK